MIRLLELVLILALADGAPAAQKSTQPARREYVGSAVCQGCHEELANEFAKSPHHILEEGGRHNWKERACESCHGPGSAHAEGADPKDIRNPLKLMTIEAINTCLNCHRNQPSRVGVVRGGHARNQVACMTCHSIHKPKPAKATAVCGSCHVAQLAQFQRPYRHRLQEGGVDCVDCHNPHGRLLTNALREVSANEPGCFRCHGDKRGPFSFEHAPMRLEGCSACHEPHGSANPRMLTRHEVRYQCLECHSNLFMGGLGGQPTAAHDLRSARFQNCTVCHVKIHGSHVNRAFLR